MLTVLVALLFAQLVPPSPSPSPLPPAPSPTPSALAATPASLGLHPGAAATLTISGAAGTISATSGALVSLSVDQTAHAVTVTAAGQLGRDTIHVSDQTGAAVDVRVLVAQDAGSVPPAIALRVTGSPIDPAWLASEVSAAVTRNATLAPGATLTAPTPSIAPPLPGAAATVPVAVAIAGNGTSLDVASTTSVTIQNVGVEPFAPPTLMYDDDPEHVSTDGVLYRGTIDAGTPSRLYFYHDNTSDPRNLAVVLSTASNAPASVQVIDSTAGPNIDVMSVGHAVSRNFLLMKPRNEGVIYDVAASAPVVLHDVPMSRRQLVAGSLGLNVLSGGPVTVTVLATASGADPRTMLGGPVVPGDGHHRTGIFGLTNFGTDSLAYAVGGNDASIVYGDRQPTPPNVDPASGSHDYGDYGVIHTLLFSLRNPTVNPATVYLYERPIGGVVRSSFVVDGNLIEMGCVRVNTVRYQVSAFSLAPSSKYQLTVQTMTDGGSNYPLEVGLSTTAPAPTTPPVSAADGCFPKSGSGI